MTMRDSANWQFKIKAKTIEWRADLMHSECTAAIFSAMIRAFIYFIMRSFSTWWAGLDLNQRRRKPVDLQSTPFNRSGTYPCHVNGAS